MVAFALAAVAALAGGCRRKHAPIGPPAQAAQPTPVAPPSAEAPPPVENAPSPPASPSAPPPPASLDAATFHYEVVDGGAGGTVNGDPNGPKADEMNRILKAGLPKLEGCLNASTEIEYGKPLQVSVQYKVGNDGKPTDVQIKGPVSATVQSCLQSQVQALPYPAFSGAPIAHSFPINYQRDWKKAP